MEPVISRLLRIEGHVQGVGFRWSLCQVARQGRIAGWVRNRRDGSVEALVRGNEKDVLDLIAWAQEGPPGARVDRVTIELSDTEEITAGNFAQAATL